MREKINVKDIKKGDFFILVNLTPGKQPEGRHTTPSAYGYRCYTNSTDPYIRKILSKICLWRNWTDKKETKNFEDIFHYELDCTDYEFVKSEGFLKLFDDEFVKVLIIESNEEMRYFFENIYHN